MILFLSSLSIIWFSLTLFMKILTIKILTIEILTLAFILSGFLFIYLVDFNNILISFSKFLLAFKNHIFLHIIYFTYLLFVFGCFKSQINLDIYLSLFFIFLIFLLNYLLAAEKISEIDLVFTNDLKWKILLYFLVNICIVHLPDITLYILWHIFIVSLNTICFYLFVIWFFVLISGNTTIISYIICKGLNNFLENKKKYLITLLCCFLYHNCLSFFCDINTFTDTYLMPNLSWSYFIYSLGLTLIINVINNFFSNDNFFSLENLIKFTFTFFWILLAKWIFYNLYYLFLENFNVIEQFFYKEHSVKYNINNKELNSHLFMAHCPSEGNDTETNTLNQLYQFPIRLEKKDAGFLLEPEKDFLSKNPGLVLTSSGYDLTIIPFQRVPVPWPGGSYPDINIFKLLNASQNPDTMYTYYLYLEGTSKLAKLNVDYSAYGLSLIEECIQTDPFENTLVDNFHKYTTKKLDHVVGVLEAGNMKQDIIEYKGYLRVSVVEKFNNPSAKLLTNYLMEAKAKNQSIFEATDRLAKGIKGVLDKRVEPNAIINRFNSIVEANKDTHMKKSLYTLSFFVKASKQGSFEAFKEI